MPSLGLRANLALYLAVLLVAAMGLIDVVVTMAAQHVLIKAERQKLAGFVALARVAGLARRSGESILAGMPAEEADPATWLVHLGRIGQGERHLLWGSAAGDWAGPLEGLAARAVAVNQDQFAFYGRTWGVFKPEPQFLLMAVPEQRDGPSGGAVVAVSWLGPVYHDLRRVQAILLLYMGINALVLTLVGFKRFHTIIFKPIKRLVKAAEEHRPEAALPFGEPGEKTEFGRLSASLNQMLRRIGQDKQRLQAMVACLEEANRQLHQSHRKMLGAEKLAVAGRLSAGIAHEIGNPVSIVLGYLALLRQEDLPAEQRRDFLRRSQDEVNRIHGIITRLLDLARPSAETRRPTGLHQVIGRVGQLVQDLPLMAGIDFAIDTAASRDTVLADGEQIQQVLLNLLLNAADAVAAGIPAGGRIVIATANPADTGPDTPQGVIRVTVTDNGVGIAADRLALVFDPFYTTKDPGRGTGLGLAVSLTIIEAHGGRLTVESAPGQGTVFAMELPLVNTKDEG